MLSMSQKTAQTGWFPKIKRQWCRFLRTISRKVQCSVLALQKQYLNPTMINGTFYHTWFQNAQTSLCNSLIKFLSTDITAVHSERSRLTQNISPLQTVGLQRLILTVTCIHFKEYFSIWTPISTVELQWLEHLWDHRKLFETWVVRATEG